MQSDIHSELIRTWFCAILSNIDLCDQLSKITLLITDVDGCLTPGNIMLLDGRDEGKDFSIQDGYGIGQALKNNLQIAFLTGRVSASTAARAQRLGIAPEFCVMGIVEEKEMVVRQMQQVAQATTEQTLFFGDDVQDYKVRPSVALFASPSNAVFYVLQMADIKIPIIGGHGALRLLIDLILYIQNKHFAQSLLTAALHDS